MSRIRRMLCSAGLVLLALAALFGCSRVFWDVPDQNGWYIQLNVGNPGAKKISVDEYEVTGLSISVYDPDEQLLDAFDWDAAEGPVSRVVQVARAGTHRIEVTHFGRNDGEAVETTESALLEVRPMVITVIDITPGAIGAININGEQTQIDLTGYWNMSWMTAGEEDIGPIPFYILQTGSTLDCAFDITGGIDGSSVIFEVRDPEEGDLLLEGTVSGDEICGTVTGGPGGTFCMVRWTPIGRLDVEGTVQDVPVSVHTDHAFGGHTDIENGFQLEFFDHETVLFLWFGVGGVLGVGVYEMPADQWWVGIDWRPPGGPELGEIDIDDPGTLTITRLEASDGIAGSFDTMDGSLAGSFDVSFFEQAF